MRIAGLAVALRECRVFSNLDDKNLTALAKGCKTRSLPKGGLLYREGDRSEGLYIIQSGYVGLHRRDVQGRDRILRVLGFADCLGEFSPATSEMHILSATAVQPSQVILVPRELLLKTITENPPVALGLLNSTSTRMMEIVESLHNLIGHQIEGRLALWLLERLSEQEAARRGADDFDDESGIGVVVLWQNKKQLASELGVASETLSRTFARFRDECIIHVIKKHIYILEHAALEAYAHGLKRECTCRNDVCICNRKALKFDS